jgi:Domain of unknown function (DUF4261)
VTTVAVAVHVKDHDDANVNGTDVDHRAFTAAVFGHENENARAASLEPFLVSSPMTSMQDTLSALVADSHYDVELLYDKAPVMSSEVAAAVFSRCPGADVRQTDAGIYAFHTDTLADNPLEVPGQTIFVPTEGAIDHAQLERALEQNWKWDRDGARKVVARATHHLLALEMMSLFLDRFVRLDIFSRALCGFVEATRPIAIHWRPAGSIVNPDALIAFMKTPAVGRAEVALNARLFRVEGKPHENFMDTLGLAPFGLPDLQIHFRKLDVNEVAIHLLRSALYVWEAGDVIRDGNTLDGLAPGEKWRCKRGAAFVGPDRDVITLDPGPRFAAP